jgi:hypothetical protein
MKLWKFSNIKTKKLLLWDIIRIFIEKFNYNYFFETKLNFFLKKNFKGLMNMKIYELCWNYIKV